MRSNIITFSNLETREYFFSTDYCQEHGMGDNFVSCAYRIPNYVKPRESRPSGLINSIQDYIDVFLFDLTEIPNPDPQFQPIR